MRGTWARLTALPPLRRSPARFAATSAMESTLSDAAWQRRRRATMHWALWGAAVGALAAVVAFAPAVWLARAVETSTGGRVLLADARGTVWAGSAVLALTGGPDSRDASTLPGRLAWSLQWRGRAIDMVMRHACCLNGDLTARWQPGWARQRVSLLPMADGSIGQWPASLLAGLGTPWNTMQLNGRMRLSSPGLSVEWVQGRLRFIGLAQVELANVSSRLSTLEPLGTYRITVQADAAGGDAIAVNLTTAEGALRLSGQGQITGGRLRFRGEAQAAPGSEVALGNLLGILGRREGALTKITIG
jgi:general secretion pathway protein N